MRPSTVLARVDLAEGRAFELVAGDLLAEPVDAIVNAANGRLAHGGGVAAAIARAAGPQLEQEGARIVAERGPIAVGDAVATGAGRLPFRAVLHAVGPVFGEGDEEAKLVRALGAAFSLAALKGLASVSFPAVSSGIFAVPLELCARAYVRAVREYFAADPRSPLRLVRLCVLGGPLVELVRAQMSAQLSSAPV